MTTRNIGRATRAPKPDKFRERHPANHTIANTEEPDEEYQGRAGSPAEEFQFKPGQSGNPKGANESTP